MCLRTLVTVILFLYLNQVEATGSFYVDRNKQLCIELGKRPYFDIDLVVGKAWRVYYTWYADLTNKCIDMTVKNATPSIINRFYNDMGEYVATQPVWDAATLHVTVGTAKHELLLFVDQGSEGSFLAVPNVRRDGKLTPARKGVPLLTFFLKLFKQGKFLLMMDCHIGVASLMAKEHPPYRSELVSVASSLGMGEGSHACVVDTRNDEKIPEHDKPRY